MFFLICIVVKRAFKKLPVSPWIFVLTSLICGILVLSGCKGLEGQKTLRLRDGSEVDVFFELDSTDSGERILVADFRNDKKIRKEVTAEREVYDIWTALSEQAERLDAEEGLIKYRYPTGAKNEDGKNIYELLLFSADRTETGRWTIRRVN